MASSLVGERMRARAPTVVECDFSFWMMGITKEAVFPLPVLAIAMTLKPWSMIGMALLWMGVGKLYPLALIARYRNESRL